MKSMKKPVSIALVFFFVLAICVSANASNVRGRINRRDISGRVYGAPYVRVTLSNPQMGRSAPAYTGTDGMYYFYDVPSGYYELEVWITQEKSLVYRIQVQSQPSTDIAPIVIP